jgi:hypothetical protein
LPENPETARMKIKSKCESSMFEDNVNIMGDRLHFHIYGHLSTPVHHTFGTDK